MADVTDPDLTALPPPRRPNAGVLMLAAFAAAAAGAVLLSWGLAHVVEARSVAVVNSRLMAEGYTWATVEADGLIVALSGTASSISLRS